MAIATRSRRSLPIKQSSILKNTLPRGQKFRFTHRARRFSGFDLHVRHHRAAQRRHAIASKRLAQRVAPFPRSANHGGRQNHHARLPQRRPGAVHFIVRPPERRHALPLRRERTGHCIPQGLAHHACHYRLYFVRFIFRHFMKSLGDGDILRGISWFALAPKKPPSVISPHIENIFPITASCSIACLHPRDRQRHAALFFDHAYKPGGKHCPSAGPRPGWKFWLGENGREVGTQEIGEIIVRSRYLSPGYWRNDSPPHNVFPRTPPKMARADFAPAISAVATRHRRAHVRGPQGQPRQDSRLSHRNPEVEDALNQLPETEQAIVQAQNRE